MVGDFPGGLKVKNPPCSAGDTALIPGWGTTIPRAVEQLSLCPPVPTPYLLPVLGTAWFDVSIPMFLRLRTLQTSENTSMDSRSPQTRV